MLFLDSPLIKQRTINSSWCSEALLASRCLSERGLTCSTMINITCGSPRLTPCRVIWSLYYPATCGHRLLSCRGMYPRSHNLRAYEHLPAPRQFQKRVVVSGTPCDDLPYPRCDLRCPRICEPESIMTWLGYKGRVLLFDSSCLGLPPSNTRQILTVPLS